MNNDLNLKKELLLNLYERQISLHKFADSKSYLILIILGFIAWKIIEIMQIINNFDKYSLINIVIIILLITLVFSFIVSFIYAVLSIFPFTRNGTTTPLFWGNVNKFDIEEIIKFFLDTNDKELLKELIKEYKINSEITIIKFKYNKYSMIFMIISVFLFLIIKFLISLVV